MTSPENDKAVLEKLKQHAEDTAASLARHKVALTTIPEDAKHIPIRVAQQMLIDKIAEELQQSKDKLARLEQTIADAETKRQTEERIKALNALEVEYAKHPPRICDFGHPTKYAGPKRPNGTGLSGNSWKAVADFPVVYAFDDATCGTRFLRSAKELEELSKSQKQPAKGKPAIMETWPLK
jgi:hypothetical protein